ncbi:hypothetical protein EDB87DRAFT_1692447 [Lactarius vividus]|nr:hypothetical protein EDB87DRAFT_1692447 [Lactarius vividus]
MSKEPLLDTRNPCYSSTESASSFLKNISSSFVGPPASREQYLLSFLARLIYPSPGIAEDLIASSSFLLSSHPFSQRIPHTGASPSDDVFVPFSPTIGVRRSFQSLSQPLPDVPAKRPASLLNNNGDSRLRSSLVLGLSLGKREYASLSSQSPTFSDLCGSSKRMRSSLRLDQSSFEVAKADPFANLARSNRSCSRGVELDALDAGLVSRSESVHSSVLIQGHLNSRLLELLGKSPITRLNLRSSLASLSPYELDDVLQVFRKLHNFRALSILVLEDVPLTDDDLLHIHHLPSLEELNLNCTGICDTGIFYLVALRHTLTTLMLRGNRLVTDNALPALLLLSRLRILGLRDTIISMTGLRRLIPFSDYLFLDVPTDCEAYIDTLHTQYLLSPLPPLITQPEVASTLELAALKRNLSAHAAYNSAISTTGNKSILCAQLITLLEKRRGDLAVREMVWRSREPEDGLDLANPSRNA